MFLGGWRRVMYGFFGRHRGERGVEKNFHGFCCMIFCSRSDFKDTMKSFFESHVYHVLLSLVIHLKPRWINYYVPRLSLMWWFGSFSSIRILSRLLLQSMRQSSVVSHLFFLLDNVVREFCYNETIFMLVLFVNAKFSTVYSHFDIWVYNFMDDEQTLSPHWCGWKASWQT